MAEILRSYAAEVERLDGKVHHLAVYVGESDAFNVWAGPSMNPQLDAMSTCGHLVVLVKDRFDERQAAELVRVKPPPGWPDLPEGAVIRVRQPLRYKRSSRPSLWARFTRWYYRL